MWYPEYESDMETGKAAVWLAKHSIETRSIPIPDVQEDGLLIRMEASGVCGTDGHLIEGDPPYPAIMCHEICGKIVEMGSRANETLNVYGGPLKVGDRIALYPWIMNPRSEGCLKYGPGTCTVTNDSFVYGIPFPKLGLEGDEIISSRVDEAPYFKGGFAEYVYVFPDTYVWKLPDDMPSEVAGLLDPLAVAVRSVELAQTAPGVHEEAFNTSSQVVVVGAGPVGVLTALVCRMMGVEKVIMIGARKTRLRLSKEVAEVDEIIDIHEMDSTDRIQRVKDITSGGADVVIQCANVTSAFVEGLEMIRRLGTLVETGNMVNQGSEVMIDPAKHICLKHARILGMSANHPGAFDKAFHILKRHQKIPFTKLFTHHCGVEGVLDTLGHMRDQDYMKGLMTP